MSLSEAVADPQIELEQARRIEPHNKSISERSSEPVRTAFAFKKTIDNICDLPWESIGAAEVLRVALAYYYFSIQFRENLEIACRLYPDDPRLELLRREECNTNNLSPWENVAALDEKMNHDEFMRRLLALQPLPDSSSIVEAGVRYLELARNTDDVVRARSIASYEDGGLERVFSAILRAPSWQGSGQRAFRFFLEQHIKFDSNDINGHGALSRHIPVDDSISPLWSGFLDLLTSAVAAFAITETDASATENCR